VRASLVIHLASAVVEAVPGCATPSCDCMCVLRLMPSPDSKRVIRGLDQKNVIVKKKTDT